MKLFWGGFNFVFLNSRMSMMQVSIVVCDVLEGSVLCVMYVLCHVWVIWAYGSQVPVCRLHAIHFLEYVLVLTLNIGPFVS